jgi:hypothetical protein
MTIRKSVNCSETQVSILPTEKEPVRLKGGYRKTSEARQGCGSEAPATTVSPILDSMVGSARTDTVPDKDSRKRRRGYHRLRTGLAFHHGQRLRFLTLTLVRGSGNDIHRCFRAFKERVRRLTPNKIRKLSIEGYLTEDMMKRYFGDSKNWNKKIKFEYFSVIIKGERPHMHILYFGDWLPYELLRKIWLEITGDSEIVDIRTTHYGIDNEKKLAGYILAQYALFQEGDIRFQMSQGWAWRGMVRDWKKAVKKYTKQVRGKFIVAFKDLLDYWVKIIRSKKTKQMVLE